MATVTTSDEDVFGVTEEFVNECKILGEFNATPLPNINTVTFLQVQYFFEHGKLSDYANVNSVIVAADYLYYDTLIDHCAEYIATKVIKGMTSEQIKKYFESLTPAGSLA